MGMEMEGHNWEYLNNPTKYSFADIYPDQKNGMKLVFIRINIRF